ncbi:MAG: hypothetical protein R2702_03280 [Acidimicrobiales bacterium]
MLAYGVGTLILMQTDHRQWALDHSLAEIVSWSDRRRQRDLGVGRRADRLRRGQRRRALVPACSSSGLQQLDRQQRAMYQDDAAVADPPPDPPSDPTPDASARRNRGTWYGCGVGGSAGAEAVLGALGDPTRRAILEVLGAD